MLASDIITRVQRTFGDTNQSQITEADIIRWINDAVREIQKRTEVLQGTALLDTAVGSNDIPLPDDFFRDRRLEYQGVKIERTTLDELDLVTGEDPTKAIATTPSRYYIWGDQLHLYPYPNALGNDVIKLFYIRLPTPITTGADELPLPEYMHMEVFTFCMARARELNEEYGETQRLLQEFMGGVGSDMEIANNPNADSYPSVREWFGDYGW